MQCVAPPTFFTLNTDPMYVLSIDPMYIVILSLLVPLALWAVWLMFMGNKMSPIVAQRVAEYTLFTTDMDRLVKEQLPLVDENAKDRELHLRDIQLAIDASSDLLRRADSILQQLENDRTTIEKGQDIYDGLVLSVRKVRVSLGKMVDNYSLYYQHIKQGQRIV